MLTREQIELMADLVEAYFVDGGSGIYQKKFDEVLAWLKSFDGWLEDERLNRATPYVKRATEKEMSRAVTLGVKRSGMYPIDGFELPYEIPYRREIEKGDTVYGGRVYYDEWGATIGVVQGVDRDFIDIVDEDGHKDSLSLSSVWKVEWAEGWKNEPCTAKQLATLAESGDVWMFIHPSLTKKEASIFIDRCLPSWAVGWCHYCGAPAGKFNFFDVPACEGCG